MQRMQDHKNTAADYDRAKELRKLAPMTERIVWNDLSAAARKQGLKFRKQFPLPPYFADFICLKARLIVELDGFSHDNRQMYDRKRDEFLRGQGYTVLRFTNDDALQSLESVITAILEKANSLILQNRQHLPRPSTPSPNPSRKGRGTSSSIIEPTFHPFEEGFDG
jgi:very-short-patch-repair endonuclease